MATTHFCETCRYWVRDVPIYPTSPPSTTGQCHRYPVMAQKAKTDWCGEHHLLARPAPKPATRKKRSTRKAPAEKAPPKGG